MAYTRARMQTVRRQRASPHSPVWRVSDSEPSQVGERRGVDRRERRPELAVVGTLGRFSVARAHAEEKQERTVVLCARGVGPWAVAAS